MPVYGDDGEIERYNVFHASMLIRCASDEKMYLYDIIDIKKETSNSFDSKSTRQKTHFLNSIITSELINVNKKISDDDTEQMQELAFDKTLAGKSDSVYNIISVRCESISRYRTC